MLLGFGSIRARSVTRTTVLSKPFCLSPNASTPGEAKTLCRSDHENHRQEGFGLTRKGFGLCQQLVQPIFGWAPTLICWAASRQVARSLVLRNLNQVVGMAFRYKIPLAASIHIQVLSCLQRSGLSKQESHGLRLVDSKPLLKSNSDEARGL